MSLFDLSVIVSSRERKAIYCKDLPDYRRCVSSLLLPDDGNSGKLSMFIHPNPRKKDYKSAKSDIL